MTNDKFRAWDKKNKKMHTHFEPWFIHPETYSIDCGIPIGDDLTADRDISEFVIDRYTDYSDRRKKEIYENDRVSVITPDFQKANGIVKMIDGCWMVCFRNMPQNKRPWRASPGFKDGGLRVGQMYLKMFCSKHIRGSSIEVIGTIHECQVPEYLLCNKCEYVNHCEAEEKILEEYKNVK